jgi:hypothetical protein
MSLVTTASLWTNDDNQKKRTPTMRRTIKLKPNISTSSEPDEYISQSENYQNLEPSNINDIQKSLENRNNHVNDLLNKITAVDNDDNSKMGSFNPLPNPSMNIKKDMDDNNTKQQTYTPPQISYASAANSQKNLYRANDTSSSVLSSYNDSYQQPNKLVNQPYYSNMGIGITGGDNKVMEKINYMIHLLEEQQNEKTNNITEEFILYTFLGVFIIFVVDSFARSGKYTR